MLLRPVQLQPVKLQPMCVHAHGKLHTGSSSCLVCCCRPPLTWPHVLPSPLRVSWALGRVAASTTPGWGLGATHVPLLLP